MSSPKGLTRRNLACHGSVAWRRPALHGRRGHLTGSTPTPLSASITQTENRFGPLVAAHTDRRPSRSFRPHCFLRPVLLHIIVEPVHHLARRANV